MRKIFIGALALITIASTIVPANAQYRRYATRHGNPTRWVGPAIVGGLALGVGSALVYHYRHRCWIEEQDVVDRRGRYIGTHDVEVCN